MGMSRGEFRDVYFLERVALLAFGGLLDLVGEVAVLAPFRVALGLAGLSLALGFAGEAAVFLPLRVFAGVALAGLSVLDFAGLFFPFLAAALEALAVLAFLTGLAAFFAWAPRLDPLAVCFDSSTGASVFAGDSAAAAFFPLPLALAGVLAVAFLGDGVFDLVLEAAAARPPT